MSQLYVCLAWFWFLITVGTSQMLGGFPVVPEAPKQLADASSTSQEPSLKHWFQSLNPFSQSRKSSGEASEPQSSLSKLVSDAFGQVQSIKLPSVPSVPSSINGLLIPNSLGTSTSNASTESMLEEVSRFALCSSASAPLGRRLQLDATAVSQFDPLKFGQEVVVSVLVIVILLFIYQHRKEVLILLTGDDRIHGSCLDCVWFSVFRCCGLFTHDWTRWITSLPCCPSSLQGSNIINNIGRGLGVTPKVIEISNIVIGDLPIYNYGSFFLTIECRANPPMATALQEDQSPKIVHFPEVLTLSVRESSLEEPVVITVKQVKFVGFEDLCEVRLSSVLLLHWAQTAEIRRFAMRPFDRDIEVETPPWVSMEISCPRDARSLDRFHPNAAFSTMTRTATYDASAGHYVPENRTMTQFKTEYALVDNTGNIVDEPDEPDLLLISWFRSIVMFFYILFTILILSALGVYGAFRYYVSNCYDKFTLLTIAKSWDPPVTFPVPNCVLRSMGQDCYMKMKGTGIQTGEHLCRPTEQAVLKVCTKPPQKRPMAFEFLTEDLGIQSYVRGLKCFDDLCEVHDKLVQYDDIAFFGSIALLIWTLCFCRPVANKLIQCYNSELQKRRNQKIQARRKPASSSDFWG